MKKKRKMSSPFASMEWHVSELAIHWFPLCSKTNKQNLCPQRKKKNLSLLGCMQPPLIRLAEFTLLPKCVQPSYNGFPMDGALLGARSHNPGSHSLSCWLLYSRGNSPSLILCGQPSQTHSVGGQSSNKHSAKVQGWNWFHTSFIQKTIIEET